MMRVVVLGAAAGGGVPQWNCGCPMCRAAFADPAAQRTQASVAVSADGAHWFLINASPDLRQQVIATPQLHPREGSLRHSPIAGVILTNGEVDAVAGLLSMREGAPFSIYGHAKVLAVLRANSIFNVLNDRLVPRRPIEIDQPFEPALPDGAPSGLVVTAFAVPGKAAWYLEGQAHPGGDAADGDTLGLTITDKATGTAVHVLTACARVTEDLKARLAGAAVLLFDGTVWRDDELIVAGLGHKTGQAMGHIAMSGDGGAIAALDDLGIAQKLFVHINNSNPALLADTAERRAVEEAGWTIPPDGTEVTP
ncbi:pyrroloquinoline quinone biosynthesis protein PqqB [Rhodopseudomonas sp. HC1]|uniref:pyrroloquinoline quinone biosynthesis protein PqqB n=1 Tax=Rhodopseudomonas infernalis TaxID=2897386 RepID=UPI001EE80B22|nr:pyrroloquinoline quinone biosynthesis protein PqqB [Rhodopseudomonas infernalis]MCG6203091.1 pyrroloquinoline quinone biosynthesis protein PqqB [Rhodopseudomonas infernalis]